jgi:hypothetical protein
VKIGLLPLGRPTFDVAYAEEKLTGMLARLDETGFQFVGSRELLMDEDATKLAIEAIAGAHVDLLLILQVTFTDASMTVAAARTGLPLAIWAVPEPRLGGRLRLNAFLASHALGRNGINFSWAYSDAENLGDEALSKLLAGPEVAVQRGALDTPAASPRGEAIAANLRGKKIARLGERPTGFDTCDYDTSALDALAGVSVAEFDIDHLFNTTRSLDDDAAAPAMAVVAGQLQGLDTVDPPQLNRSLRLKAGFEKMLADGGYDAFAVRCWPEAFTEYGGAVCGPVAMMGEARVPCACEADVYGALTQLILQDVAEAPVFLTDLVDIDTRDDTGVIWHCGQAPWSMRDPEVKATATVHTNRKQPLLYQFTLKPGTITFMRISQSHNKPKMVLGLGEMLRRPMAFTGTSGVLRFEKGAKKTLHSVLDSGLEHHVAIAYGDHRDDLRGVAGALGLPVLEI